MRFTVPYLFCITVMSAVAVAADSPSSVALQRERRGFEREHKAATQPVLARYLVKLEALKKSATQAGDLEGALAIQREIETVTGIGKRERFTDKKFRFRRTISGTPILTLSRDGSIIGSDHPNEQPGISTPLASSCSRAAKAVFPASTNGSD